MSWQTILRNFFMPRPDRRFWLRLVTVTLAAWVFFGWICRPMRIRGASMEPHWRDGGFTCCWRPRFWFRPPRRGDVVMIRFAGERVMLLKRVVASGGETVEFRAGKLLVDGRPLAEPYLAGPCQWELPQRTVAPGKLYVIGDNRTMPMAEHQFGEVHPGRVAGGPLW